MADKTISSPTGAFVGVTDYRYGIDADSKPLGNYQEAFEARANVALAVGDVLTWVVPTATVPLSVTNAVATGGSGTFLGGYRFAGVCFRAAAVGAPALVVKYGFGYVNIGSGTAAIGDMAVLGASAGQADVIALATGITAGTFAGNVLGIFLGVKGNAGLGANVAPIWITQV